MSARSYKPTRRGTAPPRDSKPDFTDDGPTNVYDHKKHKTPGPQAAAPQPQPQAAASQPPPAAHVPQAAESQKIVAISMKTPADPNLAPVKIPERELPHVRLRAMSEVSRAHQPLQLGNLAPPYDPTEARKRNMKEYVLWGCVAVILASGIALVVWFVAT